jgi:hypothetical protein
MPNLRLSSTFLLAALLGACQQTPVDSTPAPSFDAAPAAVSSPAPAPVASSSAAVLARMQELRSQVQQLKSSIDQHLAQLTQIRQERQAVASQYYAEVGEISAKLQGGTTPSNPILTAKWTHARSTLDQLEGNLSRVTALANDMATDGQTGTYLDDSTRATFAMPGALDEDHYQLRALQADVVGSQAEVGDELTDVTNEINRQNAALAVERNNIAILAESVRVGELLGHSFANGAPRYVVMPNKAAPAAPAAAPAHSQVTAPRHKQFASHKSHRSVVHAGVPGAPSAPPAGTPTSAPASAPRHFAKPARATPAKAASAKGLLLTIRFDRFTERYEEALYRAVSQALEAQPDANFEIVGTTPEAAIPAGTAERLSDVRRHVGDIQRSMLAFGLTPARISTTSVASATQDVEVVRIYRR